MRQPGGEGLAQGCTFVVVRCQHRCVHMWRLRKQGGFGHWLGYICYAFVGHERDVGPLCPFSWATSMRFTWHSISVISVNCKRGIRRGHSMQRIVLKHLDCNHSLYELAAPYVWAVRHSYCRVQNLCLPGWRQGQAGPAGSTFTTNIDVVCLALGVVAAHIHSVNVPH